MKKLMSWFWSKFKPKRQITKLQYKFNIEPDQLDKRDYVKAVSLITLPNKIDYSSFVTVKQQGSIGSCGSHAAVTGLEMLDKTKNYKWIVELSELYHYYVVRQDEYFGNFPEDTGQDGRNAMKVLSKNGVCPEKLDPYNVANFNKQPGIFCNSFAKFWKIDTYERCYSIDAIKTALVEQKAVWLGIPVNRSIMTNKGSIIHYSHNNVVGGHAVLVVGYDNDKSALKVVNSWGTNWGIKGFGWIAYDYLTTTPWFDAWSFNLR